MSPPSLYFSPTPGVSLNSTGILAAPADYAVSSFIVRLSALLYQTGDLSVTPESCLDQCWNGAKGLCIAARYHLADPNDALARRNGTGPVGETAMCEAIRRPILEDAHNNTIAVPIDMRDTFKFKFGDLVTGYGAFPWVPQAVNVVVEGPTTGAEPVNPDASASACFDLCNRSPNCWVSTFIQSNRTCRHYPMATEFDESAPKLWVWPLGKSWTPLPKDVQVKNLTELVEKSRMQKGMPRTSNSEKMVFSKLLMLATYAVCVLLLQV